MEDATKSPEQPSSTVYVRRPPGGATATVNSVTRPASAPVDNSTTDATVTVSIRRPKSQDDKGKCIIYCVCVYIYYNLIIRSR